MNMKLIDAAVASYKDQSDERDSARLEFFRGLWELQEHHASLVSDSLDYEAPDLSLAESLYWDEKPFFLTSPVTVDEERFIVALEDCSCYLVDNAGLPEEVTQVLRFFDWRGLVEESDLTKAGYDPIAYLDACCKIAETREEELQLSPEIAILVLSYALRPMLQNAAHSVMEGLAPLLKEGNTLHDKPLFCPACGSKAIASFVGETPSSDGKGRLLYCGTCGTEWEFERIRCANCGTQNQTKLHYFHIEGDEAHRLHNCQKCNDYMRTTFQDELKAPFSFEVEDVVMAKLDMVAHDPRFSTETEE